MPGTKQTRWSILSRVPEPSQSATYLKAQSERQKGQRLRSRRRDTKQHAQEVTVGPRALQKDICDALW
jgi:hypothetical protein